MQPVGFGNHYIEVGERPEEGIHVAVVANVVSGIPLGGPVKGRQPHGIDVEICKLREFGGDSCEVSDSVAVQVPERPRVYLVDDGGTPPPRSLVFPMNQGQGSCERSGCLE
jgi:hypothetical protein